MISVRLLRFLCHDWDLMVQHALSFIVSEPLIVNISISMVGTGVRPVRTAGYCIYTVSSEDLFHATALKISWVSGRSVVWISSAGRSSNELKRILPSLSRVMQRFTDRCCCCAGNICTTLIACISVKWRSSIRWTLCSNRLQICRRCLSMLSTICWYTPGWYVRTPLKCNRMSREWTAYCRRYTRLTLEIQ